MTTAYNRTKMTLQLVLTGLFPTLPEDTWNNKIHQNSLDLDIVLTPFSTAKYVLYFQFKRYNLEKRLVIIVECFFFCARLRYKDLFFKTMADSSEIRQKYSKYTKFLEMMENNTGIPFKQDIVYHAGWTYIAIQYHASIIIVHSQR